MCIDTSGVENSLELLQHLCTYLALTQVLTDKLVLKDILHCHTVVRVLLHNAQYETLSLICHINVLRELYLVLHLTNNNITMRFRSN